MQVAVEQEVAVEEEKEGKQLLDADGEEEEVAVVVEEAEVEEEAVEQLLELPTYCS